MNFKLFAELRLECTVHRLELGNILRFILIFHRFLQESPSVFIAAGRSVSAMSSINEFPPATEGAAENNPSVKTRNSPPAGKAGPDVKDWRALGLHRKAWGIIEGRLGHAGPGSASPWNIKSPARAHMPAHGNGSAVKASRVPPAQTDKQQWITERDSPHQIFPAVDLPGSGPQAPRRTIAAGLTGHPHRSEEHGKHRGHGRPPLMQRCVQWLGLDLLDYEGDL